MCVQPYYLARANLDKSQIFMNSPSTSTLTLLWLLPLILWRIYARFRRTIGRQRLSKIRPWIALTIFPILIALLCLASRANPERLLWLVGAIFLGAILGYFGLNKTRFEPTPQGLFYTPNIHLGISLSLLFVARIGYRFFEVYILEPAVPHGMHDFAQTPLTLAVFGLLAGYYMVYAAGLVRWRFRVLQAKQKREALKSKSHLTC